MLTHEELMEKCQELRNAVDELTIAMCINDFTCDSYPYAHANYQKESLLSAYLANRASISDEDAEEIIRTIAMGSYIEGFATNVDKDYFRETVE